MSQTRATEILEKIKSRSQYLIGNYDSDVDIAAPKLYSITTGAKKAEVNIKIRYNTSAVIVLNTGLVIGTGGSAAAGTALTLTKRDLADTTTPVTVIRSDYILGSSGQSAGTQIHTEFLPAESESVLSFKLAASTIYCLVITSIADNNYGSVVFEIDED